MSRSGGGANFAIGLALWLALAICILMALLTALDIRPLEYAPANGAADQHSEHARNEADTRSQVWMAYAAWVQVGVSIAGLVGLIATVVFAALAWRESRRGADAAVTAAEAAKEANENAREFFAKGSRPWLTLEVKVEDGLEVVGYREENGRGYQIPYFELTAENIGASPAHYVLFGTVVADDRIPDDEAREAAYADAVAGQDGKPDGAHIFPRVKFEEVRPIYIPDKPNIGRMVYFYVFYRSPLSAKVHATARTFYVALMRGKPDEGQTVAPVQGISFQESMFVPSPD